MRYAQHGDTFLVRLEPDADIPAGIAQAAADLRIDAGSVSGIGAGYDWELGYFDRGTREYVRQAFAGEWEILSLSGNLAIKEGRPFPHVHIILGGRDFRTVGGHLFAGRVGATCELVIRKLPGYLSRTQDEATGLFLLDV
jgi:predicted DNA-binding protein with PD1-like motif